MSKAEGCKGAQPPLRRKYFSFSDFDVIFYFFYNISKFSLTLVLQ